MIDFDELPFKVYLTQGQGAMVIAAFASETDARNFHATCGTDGSYDIAYPSEPHKWPWMRFNGLPYMRVPDSLK